MTTSQLDISGVEDDHDIAIEMFNAILATSISDDGAVPEWLSATQKVVTAGKFVHQTIRNLQGTLRKYGEDNDDADDMALIADFGMTGFMGGYEIPLLDAIIALKCSHGAAPEKEDVKKKASAFLTYIQNSELISWLDQTPTELNFVADSGIAEALGGALSELIGKL